MTEELIQRFFKKECTAAESIQVSEYLKAHPELIDKYLSEEEWNNIENSSTMPEEFWDGVWANIQKKKRARAAIVYFKRAAVVACAAALIVTGFFYWYVQTGKVNDGIVFHPQMATITQPVTKCRIITNRSGKMMNIVLEDKSLVKLSSGSELSYDTPFQKNKREMWLDGDAYFNAAKDQTKPFTVYSAVLATTALGTEFRIITNGKGNNIIIKLYKGKVIIQPAAASLKGWNKDIYLLPGEQMKYDINERMVAVEKIINNNSTSGRTLANAVKKTDTVVIQSLWFNSTPLSDVLERLAKYYTAKIVFDKAEIGAMSFTGNITKNDSLPTVLKIIAQMNELEVIQQNDEFIVKSGSKQ